MFNKSQIRKLTRARRGGTRVFRALAPKLASLPNIADAARSAAATPPNASSHRCSAILPQVKSIRLISQDREMTRIIRSYEIILPYETY